MEVVVVSRRRGGGRAFGGDRLTRRCWLECLRGRRRALLDLLEGGDAAAAAAVATRRRRDAASIVSGGRESGWLGSLSLETLCLSSTRKREREREREQRERERVEAESVFFLSSFSSPSLHFPIFPLVSSLPRATPFTRSLSLPKPHPPPPPKATNDGRHYAVHADLAPRRRRRPQARLRCCSPRRWRRRARRQAAALVPWYVSAAVLSPRRSGRLSRRARGPCAGGGAVELNQNV